MPEGKAPPIGRLRNFANIFEWTDIPDVPASSAVFPEYRAAGSCWCSLRVRSGEMWLGAAQIVEQPGPRGTHLIYTRFRPWWTIRHMLEIAGVRYRIVSVSNDDARRFTILEAEQYGDAAVIGRSPFLSQSDWDDNQSHYDDGDSIWDKR